VLYFCLKIVFQALDSMRLACRRSGYTSFKKYLDSSKTQKIFIMYFIYILFLEG